MKFCFRISKTLTFSTMLSRPQHQQTQPQRLPLLPRRHHLVHLWHHQLSKCLLSNNHNLNNLICHHQQQSSDQKLHQLINLVHHHRQRPTRRQTWRHHPRPARSLPRRRRPPPLPITTHLTAAATICPKRSKPSKTWKSCNSISHSHSQSRKLSLKQPRVQPLPLPLLARRSLVNSVRTWPAIWATCGVTWLCTAMSSRTTVARVRLSRSGRVTWRSISVPCRMQAQFWWARRRCRRWLKIWV